MAVILIFCATSLCAAQRNRGMMSRKYAYLRRKSRLVWVAIIAKNTAANVLRRTIWRKFCRR